MNIIIVAKPLSTPRNYQLNDWWAITKFLLPVFVIIIGLVSLSLYAGIKFGAPWTLQEKLAESQKALHEQQNQVTELKSTVQRDMDALALRLGRLQAEAARLNALGERLARIGKLDDGEFDFSSEPALGGPLIDDIEREHTVNYVVADIEKLEQTLEMQGAQLGLLESFLFSRHLDQSLLPSGMPVRSGYISSAFGSRADPFTGRSDFHPGIDINGARGSDILAVAGGVVAFSGRKSGYGFLVEINHGNGYTTRYGHNIENLVQVGDPVRAGQVIAKMGATGRATGNHVHFEVLLNKKLVNPREYIRAIR